MTKESKAWQERVRKLLAKDRDASDRNSEMEAMTKEKERLEGERERAERERERAEKERERAEGELAESKLLVSRLRQTGGKFKDQVM